MKHVWPCRIVVILHQTHQRRVSPVGVVHLLTVVDCPLVASPKESTSRGRLNCPRSSCLFREFYSPRQSDDFMRLKRLNSRIRLFQLYNPIWTQSSYSSMNNLLMYTFLSGYRTFSPWVIYKWLVNNFCCQLDVRLIWEMFSELNELGIQQSTQWNESKTESVFHRWPTRQGNEFARVWRL